MKVLIVSSKPLSAQRKKEYERAKNLIPFAFFEFDYLTLDTIKSNIKLENTNDIDEAELQAYINRKDYPAIHVDLTDKEWKKIGIRSSLYGQSRLVGNQIVSYGRWHEKSKYQNSQHFKSKWRNVPELTIGFLHELAHGLARKTGMDTRLVHYHFYGKKLMTDSDSKLYRYRRTPTPELFFGQVSWAKALEVDDKKVYAQYLRDRIEHLS